MNKATADTVSRWAAFSAALVVLVVLVVIPLLSGSFFPSDQRTSRTTTTTEERTGATGPTGFKEETKEETLGQTSFIDRALNNSEVVVVVRLGLVVLVAFLTGLVTQRILLASYAITLPGGLSVPALDPAEFQAAARKVVEGFKAEAAVALQTLALPSLEDATFEQTPLYTEVSDPLLRFIVIRAEIEVRLRTLARAMEIVSEEELGKLVTTLERAGTYDHAAAEALLELISMADQVLECVEVERATLDRVVHSEAIFRLLFTLGHLATVERARRAPSEGEHGPSEQSDDNPLSAVLRDAAHDSEGRLVIRPIRALNGHQCNVPATEAGLPFTFWAQGSTPFNGKAFRDERGYTLSTVLIVPGGYMTIMPVNENLRPLGSVEAVVRQHEVMLTGADRAPLDVRASQPGARKEEARSTAEWWDGLLERAARDEFGYLITKRLRAGNGEWADAVVDGENSVLIAQADKDDLLKAAIEGHPSTTMVIVEGLGGLVGMALDDEGRPLFGPQEVNRRLGGSDVDS